MQSEITGIILLDKPAGFTSRAVVDEIKKMFGVKSAGHVGTLDPGATGVLPILLGRATRVAPAFERLDKEYLATVHLHKDVGDEELKAALKEFVGTRKQRPPVKSAVARVVRERRVYSIDVLGRDGKDVRLRIACEAGTYIRKLASDLGDKIGGAHLKELRRTRAGPFDERMACSMENVNANAVLPIEKAVEHMPKVVVKPEAVNLILKGSAIEKEHIVKQDDAKGLVAIMSEKCELLALGLPRGSTVKIERVVAKY